MYKVNVNHNKSNFSLSSYIEDIDVFNSTLLLYLEDPEIEKLEFRITTQKYRPDLIAEEVYGDKLYSDYVIIQSCLPISGFVPGRVIKLINLETLKLLITNG